MIYGNAIGDFRHRDPEIDMLGNKIGDLTNLDTLDKTSLVAAINEVLSSGGASASDIQAAVERYLDQHGISVEAQLYMRVSDGYIQFSTDNVTWENVISKAELTGTDGVGISSIVQTETSQESDGINVITISKTDGKKSSFVVKNGSDGETGKTAYQYAVDGGYTGSETDFAEKLAFDYKDYTDTAVRKAAPRNLLDNSDFRNPVNQRGQTSYAGNFIYTIDRWQSGDGSATLSIQGDGVKLYSGDGTKPPYIFQRLEKLRAGTYTVAAKFHDNTGNVGVSCYASDALGYLIPNSTDERGVVLLSFTITEDLNSDYAYFRIQSADTESSAVWEWAALYEGEYTAETLPEYQPKGYGAELAECQRYFWRYWNYWKLADTGIVRSDGSPHWTINHPVSMRIAPTITIPDISLFVCQYGANSYSLKTMRGESSCAVQSEIIATIDATLSQGEAIGLIVKAAGIIDFSADL